jgi:hypothetical protein
MLTLSHVRHLGVVGARGRRASLVDLAVDLRGGDYPEVTRLLDRNSSTRSAFTCCEAEAHAARASPRHVARVERVRAAFLADVGRFRAPFVRAALRAAADREAALRLRAAVFACFESASVDAADRP